MSTSATAGGTAKQKPKGFDIHNLTSRKKELIDQFDREGYVILRQVFDRDCVHDAIEAMNKLVDDAAEKLVRDGTLADPLIKTPFEKRLYELFKDHLDLAPKIFRTELHLKGLYNVFFNPRLLDVVELFLGPEIRLYPNYSARPKFPDWEGTLVLWHQDGGYTESVSSDNGAQKVDTLKMINAWSPLVPATIENGCMQFIPGTHKLGVVPHVQKTHYLEIAEEELKPRLDQAIDIELNPGDVVLFHNLLFHQGQPNQSDHIRWSMDWRYQLATQPTLRKEKGHLARSRDHEEQEVRSKEQWASLSFV